MKKHRRLSDEEKMNLKEGDEVSIRTSWGTVKGTYPQILQADTHVNLFGGKTLESQTKMADLFIEVED